MMGAAVHIGVHRAVVVLQHVQHRFRFLGGGTVIQIHQRLAVDLLIQDRELRAKGCHIKRHYAASPAGLAWVSSASSQGWAHSVTAASGRAISNSLTKPRLSMRLASAAGMPRDCR